MINKNIIDLIKEDILNIVNKEYFLFDKGISNFKFDINSDYKKISYGDLSTNIALILSNLLKININDIFNIIKHRLKDTASFIYIDNINLNSGFINIFLNKQAWLNLSKNVFLYKEQFFKYQDYSNFSYSIEFVSANPTGPLHIGHGRGAIIGDVLSNILKYLSYSVKREFYINDAGSQIDKLGKSFKVRVLQAIGEYAVLDEDSYHGSYLKDMAQEFVNALLSRYKNNILDVKNYIISLNDDFYKNFAKDYLLNKIKLTLSDYGVAFDVWFSEKSLHDSNKVHDIIKYLKDNNYTYYQDSALFFKSQSLGDDKDRVLEKNNKALTYISADIAYLKSKIDRNFDKIIMILGQDHHGYIKRLKAAMVALNNDPNKLDIIIYQLVTLKDNNDVVRMSKRSGNIISLQDVINTVGKDAARFFFLNKKIDAHLDFDINLALKKDDDNPLYYIQYAYVRAKSIIEKSKITFNNIDVNYAEFIENSEILLIKKIVDLKYLLNNISMNYQVHLLTYYLIELAQIFHNYYTTNKIIDSSNINRSKGRLFIVHIIKDCFEIGFDLIGISKPEKM